MNLERLSEAYSPESKGGIGSDTDIPELEGDRPLAEYCDALIISVNPDLKSEWGHYLHYDERLREAAGRLGCELIIYAGRELSPEVAGREFIHAKLSNPSNHFHRSASSLPNKLFKFISDSFRFASELDYHGPKRGSVTYFMYLGSIAHFFPFLIHALKNRLKCRYVLNIFYSHFNVGQYNRKPLLPRTSKSLEFLSWLGRRLNIYLTSDSRELNAKLGVRLPILPMFSTTHFWRSDIDKSRLFDSEFLIKRTQVIVSCGGLARRGKGFDKTCELIERILGSGDGSFHFLVRWLKQPFEDEMQDSLRRIEAQPDYVTFYDGILCEKDYKRLFIECDIVMIPYRRVEFHTRTSAVLSDAITLNKPIIGPRETWIGNIIQQFVFGETFNDGDIGDMHRALRTVTANIDYYKRNLGDYSRSWLAEHNPNKAANFILREPV